jgi:hypothetical protein
VCESSPHPCGPRPLPPPLPGAQVVDPLAETERVRELALAAARAPLAVLAGCRVRARFAGAAVLGPIPAARFHK